MADDPLDPGRFGSGEPFTLGVEEELLLVDPGSGELVNRAGELHERLVPPARGEVEREVHACQIELITDVCDSVADAMAVLGDLRRAALATGVGVIGSGTHPTAAEGDADFTDKERYHKIAELLGDAIATPVSALHVHVGMPDPGTAIRVFNGMRRHLPLLEAIGANAPFRHGRDTGLASAREITLRAWPRSGAPRALDDYDDFAAFARRLTAVADVPDYTFHWWKLRPHPRLGTVEIRALDVQAEPAHTAALVAAIHALAHHEAHADPVAGPAAGDPRRGVVPRRARRCRRATARRRRGPAPRRRAARGDRRARPAERAGAGLRARARRARGPGRRGRRRGCPAPGGRTGRRRRRGGAGAPPARRCTRVT